MLGLDRGVLLMVDRETGSTWTHIEGAAVDGPLSGTRMDLIPLQVAEWGEWTRLYPHTVVLAEDTGFENRYRDVVTLGTRTGATGAFVDERLPANAIVIGAEYNEEFKAYPVQLVDEEGGVVNDQLGGNSVVVFWDSDTQAGLAYSRDAAGQILSFAGTDAGVRDLETGSTWDGRGVAVSGPLAGTALAWIPSFRTQWYGWWNYHPETSLLGDADDWARVAAPEVRRWDDG